MNLPLLLCTLSALTGAIWLIDRLAFAPARRRRAAAGEDVVEPVWVDYARTVFPLVFGVLVLRSFIAEPFRIPSASMLPGLRQGDYILVDKFSYGLRLPVLGWNVVPTGAPQRGDVLVFHFPAKDSNARGAGIDYIKRVIGLPGDVVSVQDHRITLNGQPIGYLEQGNYSGTGRGTTSNAGELYLEALPGREHPTLETARTELPPGNGTWTVAPGQYFVLGDNRAQSLDSRYWGFVPDANVVGRAMVVWLNCEGWMCRESFDTARIGRAIE